jgi:hypothetical protein
MQVVSRISSQLFPDPELMVLLDEREFPLKGSMNSQNTRLWWSKNPHAFCGVYA